MKKLKYQEEIIFFLIMAVGFVVMILIRLFSIKA